MFRTCREYKPRALYLEPVGWAFHFMAQNLSLRVGGGSVCYVSLFSRLVFVA
jgi:hypothetical protein